ncbi:hypothetical protein BKG58_14820 [Mycobacteroides abscessus subsp. abscessus]|nr:hypothetical protein BKG58_14820 [Mycobacteroides abscessus subsp. abscessus]PVA37560.1 hypothetical protein DDJ98_12340 [Mycobacteroides abscessus]PVB12794.1 hypothetical protein DDJ68_23300 [Mycobacteroides abscessus]RIR98131.1 hypothetical protein D2E57_05005 [Mycobacteroides abscessus]RIS48490.1 hypothetical protein D2E60_06175 [Mycobacteroides abscessus]
MRSVTVKRSGHLASRLADIRADTDEPQQSGNGDAPERGLGFESTLFVREQAYLDLFRQAAILRIGHNPLLNPQESSVSASTSANSTTSSAYRCGADGD